MRSSIRLWVSEHTNGWEAWVAQDNFGLFSSWACRGGEDAVAIYIEESFERAAEAASFDVQRLSYHDRCRGVCGQWREREWAAAA